MKATKPLLAVGLLVVLLVGVVLLAAREVFKAAWGEEYARFRAVKVGMTAEGVVEILGEPYKVYEAGSAPENYYVDGWEFKARPITNKVFIYIATEPIAYVWLNQENRVEEVFVGGS